MPPFERARPPVWLVAVQLAAVTSYVPLEFLARNWQANPNVVSAAIVAGLVVVLAIGIYSLILLTGLDAWKSLSVVTVASLIFWHWTNFQYDPAISASLIVLGLLGAIRVSGNRLARISMLGVAVSLASFGAVHLAIEVARSPRATVEVDEQPIAGLGTNSRPDIYMLVVDAYGRGDVLAKHYGFSNDAFLASLRSQGFTVVDEAVSSYSSTHHSVASTLSMNHLGDPSAIVGPADLRLLSQVIGGDNPTVRTLHRLGYSYIHGSGEWWGSKCGSMVDVCLPGQFIDLTMFELLAQTPLRSALYPFSGDPGTRVTLDLLTMLQTWDDTLATLKDTPNFVFLHVPAPHPPLYLTSECRPDPHGVFGERVINTGFLSDEILDLRKARYVEQVECANKVVQAFVDAAPKDALILVLSDHGPDSRGQWWLDLHSWEPADIHERFGILMAMRTPCDEPTSKYAVNAVRAIMRCALSANLPDVTGEQWIVPGAHVRSPLVRVPTEDSSSN